MREDLRRILRGEAVSDFIQSDSRQTFTAEQVTQIRKSAPFSANNSQDENETVVRSAPSFGQSEKRKSSNVWMYATLVLVLISAIGLGVYFLANQPKQNNLGKSEVRQVSATQIDNNFANFESIKVPINSNTNIVAPTPIPTISKSQIQRQINQYINNRKGATLTQRNIAFGDLDSDGDEDAATSYDIVDENSGKFGTMLTIFRNDNGLFNFVTSKDIGGSGYDYFIIELTEIKASKIYARIGGDDEKKRYTHFYLKGNKLVQR
jgi:hypothetical protein